MANIGVRISHKKINVYNLHGSFRLSSISRRHVLRFLLQSPNGYHVGLCSQTPFTFGDEDLVMSCLQKVSV